MNKIDPLGLITGFLLILGGIALSITGFIFFKILMIYGVIALIIGAVILITLRTQEEIEQVKTIKKKGV